MKWVFSILILLPVGKFNEDVALQKSIKKPLHWEKFKYWFVFALILIKCKKPCIWKSFIFCSFSIRYHFLSKNSLFNKAAMVYRLCFKRVHKHAIKQTKFLYRKVLKCGLLHLTEPWLCSLTKQGSFLRTH
mgnify:CR=1 FL=1